MKEILIFLHILSAVVLINISTFSQSSWLEYDSLRNIYVEEAEFDAALMYAEKALKLVKEEFGTNDTLYADMLNGVVIVYGYLGNYNSAIEYGEKEKAVRKNLQGFNHGKYYSCISRLAWLYYKISEYDQAKSLYIKILENAEKYLGKDHFHYENNLDNLAGLYRHTGQYNKALPLFKEAVDNTIKIHGVEHLAYGARLNNLAELYFQMGKYEKALPLFYEGLENTELRHGKDHPSYGISLNNLAGLHLQMGNYDKALPLLENALENIENNMGKDHSSYGVSLNNLAGLYLKTGQYEKALPLYLEALENAEKNLGKDHSSYGINLNNLAELYREIGQYKKALPLYLEALENTEKIRGKDHSAYGERLNNLAGLYLQMGQYDNALPLYLEAIKNTEKTLGKEHAVYGARLNNLALLYEHTEKYDKALSLYLKALENAEKSLGKDHYSYGVRLNNLAGLYYKTGQYEKALPLFIEALDNTANTLGTDHSSYGVSLNNVAELYRKIGKYDKALPLFLEALKNTEESLGTEHPDYGSRLSNLARLYRAMGQYEKALPLYSQAIQNIFHNISRAFTFLSEKQKESYIKTVSSIFENCHSFLLDYSEINPEAGTMAYNIELVTKGMILQSSIQMRKSILNSGDSEALEKYDQWVLLRSNLSNQYSLPQKERNYDIIPKLEKEVEKLEGKLARISGTFQEATRFGNINITNIQKALKPNEYAVEFAAFQYSNNKNQTDSIIYIAIVVGYNDKHPHLINLCEQAQLDSLINIANLDDFSLVNLLYRGIGSSLLIKEGELEFGERLYNLIWEPLNDYIEKGSKVYYVPSGSLHQVAFAAIPYKGDKRLSDIYDLEQLITTAMLIRDADQSENKKHSIALFGGISYDINKNQLLEIVQKVDSDTRSLPESIHGEKISWPFLPGTLSEVQNIAMLAEKNNYNTMLFTGINAKEESFKSLSQKKSPCIIHIATHGFYFPLYKKTDEIEKISSKINRVSDNPLNRSGLLFAGANNTWRGESFGHGIDDGILTAYEITGVTLSNTKLVVLSACETGLGDIKGSEGVFGLQRAFKAAGAKYLLMSLWKVPDNETAMFMEYFYNQIFAGKTIQDSFIKTQNFMKEKFPDEPYKWAAFVLIR